MAILRSIQNRREWLRLGGWSLGALCSATPPLSALLSSARCTLADDSLPSQDGKSAHESDFSVILFWANGGPSHLETFDLKPEAPVEIRGPFRPTATNVPGIEICSHLPQLARMADRFAILRSLHHQRAEHSGGTHRFLTGYSSIAANLQNSEYPEIGSIVAKNLESTSNSIPSFIANTKFYGGGPAYLGQAYAPYMPQPNPLTSTGANSYDPVPIYPMAGSTDSLAIGSEAIVSLTRRSDLLRALDRLPGHVEISRSMETLEKLQRQALQVLVSSKTRAAFDLSLEPESVRKMYGETHWGKSLLTCRRLVEAGVRFVQCQANFRLSPHVGRTTTWDDHSVNCDIFKAHEERFGALDQSISALIEDMSVRGMDRNVLFVFCGEFGRTPMIRNQDASGRPGRDHWPRAMSVLLAGGGMRMGQVIGGTNRKGEEPVDRIMDSNCLLATIYHKFGIDISKTNANSSGRPIPILPSGEIIPELL